MRELTGDDPRQVGPYQLIGLLGQGGMGRVYLGRGGRAGPDGLAAVKVVHADLARDPEFRRRLLREVEAMRKANSLNVPHIAVLIDADIEAVQPWLATEYVPGPSLHSRVQGEGPVSAEAVRALGAALAEALAAIHAAGMVHRDVKPGNILMADDGPKLIDFGIALDAAASTMTRTGFVLGTPSAMAPEQIEGRRGQVGPAADVFALGAVLAFAATGEYPFGDGNLQALSYRVVHEEPHLEGVGHDLRPLILRCLAKDPADRPAAVEVAVSLSTDPLTHRAEEAPAAVPVEATAESGLRSRRRSLVVVGAVVLAALALVGGTLAVEANGSSGNQPQSLRTRGGAFATGASPSASPSAPGSSLTSTPPATSSTSPSPTGTGSATAQHPTVPVGTITGIVIATTTGARGTAPATSPPAGRTTTKTTPTTLPSTSPRSTSPSASPAGSPPGEPTHFDRTVSDFPGQPILLTWNSQTDVDTFQLLINGARTTVPGTSTSYDIVPGPSGTNYSVSLRACNQYGCSDWDGPWTFTY